MTTTYHFQHDGSIFDKCSVDRLQRLYDHYRINEHTQLLDENLHSAGTIKELLGERQNSNVGTWDPPYPKIIMSQKEYEQRRILYKETVEECNKLIFLHSVGIVDTSSGRNLAECANFSGILVKLGEHYFCATAGHCLENTDDDPYFFLPHCRTISKNEYTRPAIIKSGKSMSGPKMKVRNGEELYKIDIGFLEIAPDTVNKGFPQQSFISSERICICGQGKPRHKCLIIGFPKERQHKVGERNGIPICRYDSAFYCSPPEFHDSELFENNPVVEYELDPSIDVFLHFPACVNDANAHPIHDASGMSGGGIWCDDTAKECLWNPCNLKLIGIQSTWQSGEIEGTLRHFRGVQIIHWLQLIYSKYPDLRATISEIDGFIPPS